MRLHNFINKRRYFTTLCEALDKPYGTHFHQVLSYIGVSSKNEAYYLIKIHKTTIVVETITLTIPIIVAFSFMSESEEDIFYEFN